MKKLRLLIIEKCHRTCEGCCNKDWNLSALPIVESFKNYELIMLTGGEPLLNPPLIRKVVKQIRQETDAKIIVYTSLSHFIFVFMNVLKIVDGITLTIHEERDVIEFYNLCHSLLPQHITGKSMRLNIFENIQVSNIPSYWIVKKDIKWIKDCPLPENEEFKRLPTNY